MIINIKLHISSSIGVCSLLFPGFLEAQPSSATTATNKVSVSEFKPGSLWMDEQGELINAMVAVFYIIIKSIIGLQKKEVVMLLKG